jgi:ribosome biogenesis protein ENP2
MSNVQVSEINGLKIYNLTGGRSLYDIMKESNFSYKKLKKNEEYVNRIEIIQDFQFPVSSGCLRTSNDGNYVFASGIYAPKLKIYDLNEMTLKCERGVDSEIRKIEIISDDYSKAALLCEDRNIEIHAQYGKHFKLRIPKYGRDMVYHKTSCDLFTVGSSNEIFRLNLFDGQFMNPFISSAESINACAINYNLELLGVAGEKGIVELWDLRDKKKVNGLPILEDSLYNNYE